jgi:prepilin-type N-terminal cleavage/methylation domain-containing protein
MLRQRKGFTLIELLIVIVIIGILAAIAIPKFGKTREKAYFKAMQSDLRNLQAQQELYFSIPANNYSYATAITQLTDFVSSQGVTVGVATGSAQGWQATSIHAALQPSSSKFCALFVGNVASIAPAITPGLVTCTGEQ